jgi:polyketide biosynthesis enoyl-CoA hydratase PksI
VSDAVRLELLADGIVHVCLEDRASRNTFSEALVRGLVTTFERIASLAEAKVVVLSGYDSYFCCGGTKHELLEIHAGRASFEALDFYRMLLDCELPTIAAVQGHALGGGLAFACYADLMVLAEEGVYGTNFMKYGFTPGMGATAVVPLKLGLTLGTEMLMTARTYRGSELRARGVPVPVVGRAQVLEVAFGLARDLADKPAVSLRLLKHHLSARLRSELPALVAQEVAMHAVSFRQPEVRERVERLFGE